MPLKDKRLPLVALLGPTAVGKTEIAIEIAQYIGGEIVSADSRLFYQGMDIGTAKPTAHQRKRVPHHLIDVAEPDEIWSLAQFQAAAHQTIADIHKRGRVPIVVGGTGQYLRALLEGWSPPSVPGNPDLRRALETWSSDIGKKALHARLAIVDQEAARKIDPRNQRRTLRALEVIFTTGKRFSDQKKKTETPYSVLEIGLTRPRVELYARIDARIDRMLQEGWLDEVSKLLAKGYSPELPSLSAIGYKELVQHLNGEISLDEATTAIKRRTRQFVRRQAAWFKPKDPNIYWVDVSFPDSISKIENRIKEFLSV
ncbi:MAG: tRNA (adenosine(37)-N6)-dimethylallyltransferase MiaA [Anaerolineales bacterium]